MLKVCFKIKMIRHFPRQVHKQKSHSSKFWANLSANKRSHLQRVVLVLLCPSLSHTQRIIVENLVIVQNNHYTEYNVAENVLLYSVTRGYLLVCPGFGQVWPVSLPLLPSTVG